MEAVVAILLLGIVLLGFSGDIVSSNTGTRQAQARLQATLIAEQTIQEVEGLGYSTVVEGISCSPNTTGACTLAQNPSSILQSSGNCWYYGAPSKGLLVPTVNEATSGAPGPIIPYATAAVSGSPYQPFSENGITYNVTAVPVYNTNTYSVSCSQVNNESVPTVPISVMIQVKWSVAGAAQSLGMETTLFDSPALPPSVSSCSVATAQQGGHVEAHLALPTSAFAVSGNSGDGNVRYAYTAPSLGGTAQIFFTDEAPTTYNPTYCVLDSAGDTFNYGTCFAGPCPTGSGSCGQTNCPGYLELQVVYFGNSSVNPFLAASGGSTANHCTVVTNPQMTAVNGDFAGSGPNACQPPAAGTYCQNSYTQAAGPTGTAANCSVEELWQITLPTAPPSPYQANSINCVTVAGWDHEGDFDSYSWAFNGATNCP